MSLQNPKLAGFRLTRIRSIFFHVKGFAAWLYECRPFLLPLYKIARCLNRMPIHYKDTLMYFDPITQRMYDCATPLPCDNNPQKIIVMSIICIFITKTTTESLTTRTIPDFLTWGIFGVTFRSLGRDVPSFLCQRS